MSKPFLVFLLLLAAFVARAQDVYDVCRFGALGDGKTDDAVAIQQAIDRCSSEGGGRVLLPANHTFLAGPIELKSNVELHLQATATLLANPDESIYHLSAFGDNKGEGMMWIYAQHAQNISITGMGTISGNGVAFMGAELDDSYHLVGCDGAVIDGINLLNNLKIRNGDGIDLDHSRNVRIANCHITSGDDCICLKNRRETAQYGSCHDIVVTNCVMTSRSCAIKIGSENMDSIYNVLFDNCIIKASNRGLGIQNRDEGTVTDVVFSNIMLDCRLWSDVWWGKAEPIYVTSYPRANGNHKDANWRFPKGQLEGRCGQVERIFFQNIVATSENGCFIGGDTDDKVRDIHLSQVTLFLKKSTTYQGGVYDKRPCRGEGFVTDKVYGLYVEKAAQVTADNFVVRDMGVDYGGAVNRPLQQE